MPDLRDALKTLTEDQIIGNEDSGDYTRINIDGTIEQFLGGVSQGIYRIEKGSAHYQRSFAAGTVANNDQFEFTNNEIVNDSSNITKLSNTQIELKAGVKYMLEGSINVSSTSNGFINHQFYDVTAGAYTGSDGTVIIATSTGNSGSTTQAKLITKPTVDTVIELRNQAGDTISQYACVVEIQEL